jgi:Fungal specific transcription factor domain
VDTANLTDSSFLTAITDSADSGSSTDEEVISTTLITRTPMWTEAQVDAVDMNYFHFFVEHMRSYLPYMNLFPDAMNHIFARTLMSPPLRHAVLSISAALVDSNEGRPATRALIHKQEALHSLQDALSTKQLDENIAIAVFLMLYMDTFAGKDIVHAHLRGLSLVLKELNVDSSKNSPLYWDKVSPVVLLIWRIAFRIDHLISVVQDCPPIFPPFPAEYNLLQRKWALTLAKDGRSADWAVAGFGLDTIFQRANYLRRYAHVRAEAEFQYDAETRARYKAIIKEKVDALFKEHAEWLEQPAVVMALQMEEMIQEIEVPDNIPRFLDYPPRVLYDKKFALLLNEWRGQYLFLRLVQVPISMRRHSRTAVNHAIQICRTHAAIDLEPASRDWVSEFMSVLVAGYAFIGGVNFQKEFEWVYNEINRANDLRNPVLTQFQHFIDRVRVFARVAPKWEHFDED